MISNCCGSEVLGEDFCTGCSEHCLDEGVCQACGTELEVKSDNVGFEPPDPVHIEIWSECPNGCLQDDTVVIL